MADQYISEDEHVNTVENKDSNMKSSNPKDIVGVRKAPMSTVPSRVMLEVGLAMLEGARKYGRHNYRVAGVCASVYYDAAIGHLMSWWEGEDIDLDSNLHHLIKSMASIAVLRDGQHMENWIDDRPPRLPGGLDKQGLSVKAGSIIDSHPDGEAPFTEISIPTSAPSGLRIYLSHPIRGVKGKHAGPEYIASNNRLALEAGAILRQSGYIVHIPAEHEEFVSRAMNGRMTTSQVLGVDCEIIDTCDVVVFFDHEKNPSVGMRAELAHAEATGKKIMVAHYLAGIKTVAESLKGKTL